MSLKSEVIELCRKTIDTKIQDLKQHIKQLQSDANEDSKSAMGDKYETGRAMSHLEIENVSGSLEHSLQQKEVLYSLKNTKDNFVAPGALVYTSNGIFYISTGLGKITVGENIVFAIGLEAPIGKLLMNKKAGDTVSWNQQNMTINKVE